MASSTRKDTSTLISLLRNNDDDSGEDDEDKTKFAHQRQNNIYPSPNRKESKVAAALRKISELGTNIEETRSPHFPGQQDNRPYSFEKNVPFGRYQNDETRQSLLRKSGMAVIAPTSNGNISNDKNKNDKYSKSLRSFFEKSQRSTSKANILENEDDSITALKKRKPWYQKVFHFSKHRRNIFRQVFEDWLFLALLGIIMALLSFGMDWAIEFLQTEHADLMEIIDDTMSSKTSETFTTIVQYLLWVVYAVILVTSSALFAHYVAPQAIGSGIPEMKTILRGVILKEYLTFRTLVSKIVGLTLSLGSGLPIGKEGPFVHVASVVANLLSHLVHSFDGAYANESRSSEMLAAGCAVGVACTFSAPVGGVLFSIEVTSVYFAVRNYWRGFFAATCSATIFRLLRVYNKQAVTVAAFYQTNFPRDAFLPSELPIFALIGLLCGLLSAAFILIQRNMVLFLRKNKFAKSVFQKYWLIYPIVISGLVSSLTFNDGFGRFIGGHQKFSKATVDFFSNCTFIETNNASDRYCSEKLLQNWTDNGHVSAFLTLSTFVVTFYFLTAIASTVPIPSGIFGPSFVIGSAIGRLTGEFVAFVWTDRSFDVYPGVYAVVGGAAMAGGITHTVSVAVIAFELTGQLVYILPVMIAVLIANAVSSYLQPSIYDSIIKIKHLPYLPDIPHSSSNFHGIRVEQFMTSNVRFLSKHSSYAELQELVLNMPRLKAFPVVEDPTNRILIGSCSRAKLLQSLNMQVGPEARQIEANNRIKNAIADIDRRFKMVDRQRLSEDKRPSIFEVLEPLDSIPTVVATSATPTEKLESFDFTDRRTQSTSVPETRPNDIEESRPRAKSTSSRFKVVPVNDQKENVPGLRPGGRRGGLSVENIIEKSTDNEKDDDNSSPKLSSSTITSTSSIGKLTNKLSNNSLVSSLTNGLKRDRPKSFHAETMQSQNSTTTASNDMYHTIGGVFRNLSRFSFGKFRNRAVHDDYDLSGDERREWELQQLSKPICFEDIGVDPAPFQLVEYSSLFKVHSLFSLLGLNRAYVTKCGRLVGVVALKDLRLAIEKVQEGVLYINSGSIYEPTNHLTFEGAHLVGNSVDEEENDDDADNDKLTRRLEVISRSSSQLGNSDYEKVAEALAKSQEEDLEKPKFLAVPNRRLSMPSNPCIVTKFNETSNSDEIIPKSINKKKPKFEVSPHPSIRINSDSSSPTTSSPSSPDPPIVDSMKKRKKSRHVQICVPPTPDYKKNKTTNFDFSSSSDEL